MPDENSLCKKIEKTAALFEPFGAAGRTVFVLMSGGVDSTLCALLANQAGCRVVGATMTQSGDPSSASAARAICAELGVESWVFDARDDFDRLVVEPFRAAYMRGETPNPCVICNRTVKFGLLTDRIAERFGGHDFVVSTGHYAITVATQSGVELRKGLDDSKDQSYFLCMVPKERIDRLALPLGEFTKDESRRAVRSLAGDMRSVKKTADRAESMEICFLSEGDYRISFGETGKTGPIVDTSGAKLGEHNGIENFTVGQRKGLGLTSKRPLFVAEIIPNDNTVVVAARDELMKRTVAASFVNVLLPEALTNGARLDGKIRSQSKTARCTVELRGDDSLTAVFDEPQFAPAPGQYLALYDGDRLVAGGVIARGSAT